MFFFSGVEWREGQKGYVTRMVYLAYNCSTYVDSKVLDDVSAQQFLGSTCDFTDSFFFFLLALQK